MIKNIKYLHDGRQRRKQLGLNLASPQTAEFNEGLIYWLIIQFYCAFIYFIFTDWFHNNLLINIMIEL